MNNRNLVNKETIALSKILEFLYLKELYTFHYSPVYHYSQIRDLRLFDDAKSKFELLFEEYQRVEAYLKMLISIDVSLNGVLPIGLMDPDLADGAKESKYINPELNEIINDRYMEICLNDNES